MVRKAALVLALIATVAEAKPAPLSARIAAAKAELIEGADAAFSKVYLDHASEINEEGVTATSFRAWTLWQFLGFSIGTCDQNGGEALKAAWLSALDRVGPAPDRVRTEGIHQMRVGAQRLGAFGEMTDAQLSRYCAADVGAVKALLWERFGAR